MTSMRRLVIVGGDLHAWLAAASFRRAFRFCNLDVCVLDFERPVDAPVARWTLPSLRGMHSLLGIKETEFIQRTGATFKLAVEHHAWQGATSRYLHAHGEIGSDVQGTPFYKYLLQQARAGRRESHEAYSLAAMAARAGRFARPMPQTALTSSFTYAFHIDEPLYTAYLREHAEKLGVRRIAGRLAEVALADGGQIAALILEGGERLEAEFFVDCSGREALLMSRLSHGAREDWSAWLPNDRILSARGPAIEDARAVTQTAAQKTGWLWRLPLARSSAAGFVYSSAHLSDDAAADQLREHSMWGHSSWGHSSSSRSVPIEAAADIVCTPMSQGRRARLWERNCLALGDAAIEIEPLAGANLHMTQVGIATFIELSPIERSTRLEAIEYNRIVGEHADSLRNFTIAHYRVGARTGDYWESTRAATLPPRLQEKLDLYRASGQINLLDNEVFDELDWAWLLIGSGHLPDRIGLHARSALHGVRGDELATLRDSIERLAASMPRHMDFVRQHG